MLHRSIAHRALGNSDIMMLEDGNADRQEYQAPLVVLVHGAGGGAWEWVVWRPILESRGYRVEAVDLQPVHNGYEHTRVEDYVDQIVETCTRSCRSSLSSPYSSPTILVGASMGGVLVLKANERVKAKAIVLVCSTAPSGVTPFSVSEPHPAVVKWSESDYAATVACLPGISRVHHKGRTRCCVRQPCLPSEQAPWHHSSCLCRRCGRGNVEVCVAAMARRVGLSSQLHCQWRAHRGSGVPCAVHHPVQG